MSGQFCGVEGYCCNGSCTGDCESCVGANTGQADGVCRPVLAMTDPRNKCLAMYSCDGDDTFPRCLGEPGAACTGNADCFSNSCNQVCD